MGSSQRLAAVAAISHARHYNHTQTATVQTEPNAYTVNVFFVSATLCGVLVAVCAACWRRSPRDYKPEDVECRGVYTVSGDCRLNQIQMELPGPPPAYETVVEHRQEHKDCHMLQDVVSEPCSRCPSDELPSYEAAVMLKDTKL